MSSSDSCKNTVYILWSVQVAKLFLSTPRFFRKVQGLYSTGFNHTMPFRYGNQPVNFDSLASEMTSSTQGSRLLQNRQFISFFGVSSNVCEKLWTLLLPKAPEELLPIHLLYGLLMLKTYATESVCCSIAGVSEKTFRKWAWITIEALSNLKVVSIFLIIYCKNPLLTNDFR